MSYKLGNFETALLAELRLGLPPLFYFNLVEVKDDWGFVLKLHSFFEGTLTRVIQHRLHIKPNSRERLAPRDTFVSRVYLADRLNLLEPEFKAFLLELNRIRNDICHNIRYIDLNLKSYVHDLSDADFKRTARSLGVGFKNIPITQDVISFFRLRLPKSCAIRPANTCREFFWSLSPKATLWNSGLITLDLLSLHWHFENDGQANDLSIEAKLQDLLLDPKILDYKRKLQKQFPEAGI